MKKLALVIGLVILVSFALCGETKAAPCMSEQKVKVLLDKVLEMWNKPDYGLIPQLYTPDCTAWTSSMPEPYVGHEGIKKWIENTRAMMPDMVMAFPEVVMQGDKVATVWTMTGTQTGPMVMPGGTLPPTGNKVSIKGLAIDYMKDGKFVKEIVAFNVLDMLMQLGFQLMPPQPPPPPPPPVK